MSDATNVGDDFLTTDQAPAAKTMPPSWARRYPKRTIILAAVSAVAVLLFWLFQSTATVNAATGDPNALLAPWRYALASTVMLWVGVIAGAGSLFSWLMHVRDREYLRQELAFRTQAARRR